MDELKTLESGVGLEAEIAFPLSGGELTYKVTGEPLFDEKGAIDGVATSAVDITDLLRMPGQV